MESRRYRRLYDRLVSPVYDWSLAWFSLPLGGNTRFRRGMLEGLAFAPGERVLDATCGTGSCAVALRERLAPPAGLVGSDLSLGQLRVARRKPALADVSLLVSDASRLPFRDGAFDLVAIPHALHEMPRPLRLAVLREARRVAGDEGRVLVLELDRPANPLLRFAMAFWFLFWIPHPLNYETRTRRDMARHGVPREMAEAGLAHVTKRALFRGVMQAVEGRA